MASHAVPVAHVRLPLLSTLAALRDPLAFLGSLGADAALVQLRLGPVNVVVVGDPALTRQMLVDDRTYDKGGVFYDRIRAQVGVGLVTCGHSLHRRQRRLTQPAFRTHRLSDYAQVMTEHAAGLTAGWRDGQILDVPAEMAMTSMRTAVATMFSGASDSVGAQVIGRAVDDLAVVIRGSLRMALLPPMLSRLPTVGVRRYRNAKRRLHGLLGEIVANRRASGTEHADMLAALLAEDSSVDECRRLTDTEVLDQLVAFFGAGTETVATTLAWALDLLARHPAVEGRLHHEVDHVLAGSPARMEHLPLLPFTGRVVNETLRLYPPGWVNLRTASVDTVLGGYRIPAGTTLAYSPYLIHRRPDLYADPARFDPDRFEPDGAAPGRDAFIPFGAGPRKCIGDQFALTEAVITLATIAARWRCEALPGKRVRPVPGVTLSPRQLRMRVRERRPG